MSERRPARSPRTLRLLDPSTIQYLILALLMVVATPLQAAYSGAIDALELVTDVSTGERVVPELAAGETLEVHAVVDRLSGLALNAFQIGLEVDSSLLVVGVDVGPDTTVLEPTLSDIYVGLQNQLLAQAGPHLLATWRIVRLPGFAADHPATIRMRALENGEASQYRGPAPAHHRADFLDTGPVAIGAPMPAVLRFVLDTSDLVRGRTYAATWEAHGAQDLRLDGEPVDAIGSRIFTATTSGEHVLEWIEEGEPRTSRIPVAVLDEPEFELLAFQAPPIGTPDVYLVKWKIRGADAAWWGTGTQLISAQGDRGVIATGPTSVTLRAENEWGSVTRSLSLRAGDEPTIAAFWAEPQVIDRGAPSLLRWSVVDADRVTLEPFGEEVALDGSRSVTPDSTTTYVLRAERGGVVVQRGLVVEVIPLRIERFAINPWDVYPGAPVTLSWDVLNAEEIWIEPDVGVVGPGVGTTTAVPPDSVTTYVLHARRAEQELTASRIVRWKPPTTQLTISGTIPREFLATHAFVEGADFARVEPNGPTFSPPNGYHEFNLSGAAETLFRLVATNAAGTAVAQVHYDPRPARAWIARRLTFPYLGMRESVMVRVDYATDFEVGIPGVLPAPIHYDADVSDRVDYNFWLDQPTTIRVESRNFVSTFTDSLPIMPPLGHLVTASVDEEVLQSGQSTTLRWDSPASSGRVWIEPPGAEFERSGSLEIQPAFTTQYRLFATYAGNTFRTLVTVQVVDGETSLLAEPMRPIVGLPFELRVAMPADATHARLEPGIGEIEPHSQVLEQIVESTQEYTLEVTTPRGQEFARVLVDPDGLDAVSTVLQDLQLSGHARGARVVLQWNLESLRPPDSMVLYRAVGSDAFEPWQPITETSGEMIDAGVQSGTDYSYQLRLAFGEDAHASEVVVVRPQARLRTIMLPNAPNPFNPTTLLQWETASPGEVRLELFDLRGRLVRAVELGFSEAGPGSWSWDGRDQHGDPAASGTYVARISSGSSAAARKIVLTK